MSASEFREESLEDFEDERCYEFIEIEVLPSEECAKTSQETIIDDFLVETMCTPDCSFGCNEKLSDVERERAYIHFCQLTKKQKQNFFDNYLKFKQEHVEYYLPIVDGKTQVCQGFFEMTLNITEQKLLNYRNELECRKATESGIQEAKQHICNFFAAEQQAVAKMYKLYQAESKNPIDLKTYQRIFIKLCEKMNSTQFELEEEVSLEALNLDNFEATDCMDPIAESLEVETDNDFPRMFETNALKPKIEVEEQRKLDFENTVVEAISSSEQYLIVKEAESFEDFQETDCIDRNTEKAKGRPKNPESWKQNVRIKLCQNGEAYVDRFGVERPKKVVGSACPSTCTFACFKDFPYEARTRVHRNFWNLSTLEKRNFLAAYVEQLDIRKRRAKYSDQVEPRKKHSYRYFLPLGSDSIRVCKFFFLKTLAISDIKVQYYFKKYHNNLAAKTLTVLPGRGRKCLLQSRVQAAREHIASLSKDELNERSVAELYAQYKAKTEEPIGIDTYRRIKVKMLNEQVDDGSWLPSGRSTSVESLSSLAESDKCDDVPESLTSVVEPEQPNAEEAENADFDVEMMPQRAMAHDSTAASKKRSRNPEMWQQTIRKQLREKGLSYIDRKGVKRSGRKVGPPCAVRCSFSCTKQFTNKARQRIHENFWNLTKQEKYNFFETYVEKLQIKKRSKRTSEDVDARKNRSFHYYFPQVGGKPVRVCQFYFLKTLAISYALVHLYFDKYHKDDDDNNIETTTSIRSGRKKFPKCRMQEVRDHIKSFPPKNRLSVTKMYDLYKTETKDPVCLTLYRRVRKELLR